MILAAGVVIRLGQRVRENMSTTEKIAEANEGSFATLEAPPGGKITDVTFVSYGTPTIDSDGKPKKSNCHADIPWVKAGAVGKQKYDEVKADNNYATFDPCYGTYKKLIIAYTVSGPDDKSATGTDKPKADADKTKADAKDNILGVELTEDTTKYLMYGGLGLIVVIAIWIIFLVASSSPPAPVKPAPVKPAPALGKGY